MKKLFSSLPLCLLLLSGNNLCAQDLRFNQVLKNSLGEISDMIQDKQGFIWTTSIDKGVQRYDGVNLKPFVHNPGNPNSIASGPSIDVFADSDNMIWIGMLGAGLEKFNPATNSFTHFRHNPKDATSLSNDTVSSVLEDHLGNLWVGTFGGLDLLDRKTGRFTHYRNDPDDPASISHNQVYKVFEDKKGVLWVQAVLFSLGKGATKGALNRFDRATGKFTRYLQDPENPNSSIPGKFINDMYEDSKGNFWIATQDAGLYTLDRNTGRLTRYNIDSLHPKIPGPETSVEKKAPVIFFITEDKTGALWIGLGSSGMKRYDPISKKSTHYGYVYEGNKLVSARDTASGFTARFALKGVNTKDGLFWVYSSDGSLFNLNKNKITIPFFNIGNRDANAFYSEPNDSILWIATSKGLLRKDLKNQSEKLWTNNPKENNSLTYNGISTMRTDEEGNIWLGTRGGLDKFDPVTGKFLHYKHDPKNPGSISSNILNYLIIDHDKNLWAASDSGFSRMDRTTGKFTNYKPNPGAGSSNFGNNIYCLAEDQDHIIWAASDNGAYRLDTKTGKLRKYIPNSFLKSICVDAKGIIWTGGVDGLYYFDKAKDEFVPFANPQSAINISGVINIIEDDQENLWVSTSYDIIEINADRTGVKKFAEANGVRYTSFLFNDNYKAKDGRLFLGIREGYYAFYPDQITGKSIPPQLSISSFKLGDSEVEAEPGGILTSPVWQTREIRLTHNQNIFSFDFFAIDYITPGDEKYLFMLENYDDTWHDIGSDHRAFFFNIPPGTYNFRVKAVSGDGGSTEKTIRIIISPPWWKTWWAYSIYSLIAIIAGYLIYKYQKNHIVKRERERAQQKELAHAKEIEKAYNELKTTQAQLIQSEKMASLGELTAGIAHEIQNPLNFVNNFSEVNAELIGEMKEELSKGNMKEAKSIAGDIGENEKKIIFHGKRADSIVKGMLQHSRSSSGVKEPTDINALADEYLRLAYHGLRARDKSFNATMQTDFDKNIGPINIIPQDIGRVILNLITNAFYAVTEKKKAPQLPIGGDGYEPSVTVSTRKINGNVEIRVNDNGSGIPPKALDKIFQPFFTTKPTGQGTGLGLSLSYDIVKAHGGELKVIASGQEGTEFAIILPI